MKIFLHIGSEKTGTTSIQRVLKANSETLKREGILYPIIDGSENHVSLYNYAKDPSAIDELRLYSNLNNKEDVLEYQRTFPGRFKKIVEDGNPKTLILSNEHLSSRISGRQGVERVYSLLNTISDDVSVILYLRNPIDFMVSSYSTAVKCGETCHISDYLPSDPIPFRYRIDLVYALWTSVFGKDRVIVKPYNPSSFVNGSAVHDFLGVVDASYYASKLDLSREKENESLGVRGVELLRHMNGYLPLIESGQINRYRSDLVDLIFKSEEYSKIGLTEGDYFRAQRIFQPVLSRLIDLHPGVESMPAVVDGFVKDNLLHEYSEVSSEELAQLFSKVWKMKVAQSITSV